MKLLYVDLEYDYGIEARGVNTIGLYGFKKSFGELGFNVDVFYYDKYLNDIDSLQKDLCDYADKVKPDVVFFCLFEEQFYFRTLDYLKNKYVTINWFGDDTWRFDSFTKKYANHFTWCVTTDFFSIEKYYEINQRNVIYSQWAAIDAFEKDSSPFEYKYDVSFVGGGHPYRKWFIDYLQDKGINAVGFGHGWELGPINNDQMNDVFLYSKVNLNVSNSFCFDLRYLASSLKSIYSAIRSDKRASQIKARNFEIPFAGGFQLTDYVPHIEKYFNIGQDLVCYSTIDEAVSLIEYYLSNEVEREKIRISGHMKTVEKHCYVNRFESIFETIGVK